MHACMPYLPYVPYLPLPHTTLHYIALHDITLQYISTCIHTHAAVVAATIVIPKGFCMLLVSLLQSAEFVVGACATGLGLPADASHADATANRMEGRLYQLLMPEADALCILLDHVLTILSTAACFS